MIYVSGEQSPTIRVPTGHDVHLRFLARAAEHPFGIEEDRQPTSTRGAVTQSEPLNSNREPSGFIHRNECHEFLLDRVAIMFEQGVALTVARSIRIQLPDREWSRRPEPTGLVVTDVDGVARRIP